MTDGFPGKEDATRGRHSEGLPTSVSSEMVTTGTLPPPARSGANRRVIMDSGPGYLSAGRLMQQHRPVFIPLPSQMPGT